AEVEVGKRYSDQSKILEDHRKTIEQYKVSIELAIQAAERERAEEAKIKAARATSLLRIEVDKKIMETWKAMRTEINKKGVEVSVVGKRSEIHSWDCAVYCLSQAIDKLNNVIKDENVAKPEKAQKWREVAEQYKNSVEPYIQSARAYAAGKKDEGESWNNAGDDFYRTARKLEKAIETKAEEIAIHNL
ncbi:MAG TPA: hypothetical protein VJK54_06660, partial [Chthoniobacterales bacterium]|nr:hypothetical protein [Chthoniobacterales bacterium]